MIEHIDNCKGDPRKCDRCDEESLCPTCGGSGGGPDPALKCRTCRGTGTNPSWGGDEFAWEEEL